MDRCSDLTYLNDFLGLLPNVPKLAIMGNHEQSSGAGQDELREVYESNGCSLLVNETVRLEVRWWSLLVTGLDSMFGHPDLAIALDVAGSSQNHILLCHEPELSDLTEAYPGHFSLMPAGHTHGGQVNILGFAPLVPVVSGRYLRGWYRDSYAPMYVSSGIGTSMFPFRIGVAPEVAVLRHYLA